MTIFMYTVLKSMTSYEEKRVNISKFKVLVNKGGDFDLIFGLSLDIYNRIVYAHFIIVQY